MLSTALIFFSLNDLIARNRFCFSSRTWTSRKRRLKSSSLQSLERGKPTEIDYLNGYITKLAGQKQIPVPVNEKLVKMVKEIEAGTRQISEKNFKELENLL